jgi:hypothetical protein
MTPNMNKPNIKDAINIEVPIANLSSDSLAKPTCLLMKLSTEYGIKFFYKKSVLHVARYYSKTEK